MAHIHKPLVVAVGLNTAVSVAEAAGGIRAQSLSLLVDVFVALVVGGWILATSCSKCADRAISYPGLSTHGAPMTTWWRFDELLPRTAAPSAERWR